MQGMCQAKHLGYRVAVHPRICTKSLNPFDALIAQVTESQPQILGLVQYNGAECGAYAEVEPIFKAPSSFGATAAICGTELALYAGMQRKIADDPTDHRRGGT
jgi:hypothetical protein